MICANTICLVLAYQVFSMVISQPIELNLSGSNISTTLVPNVEHNWRLKRHYSQRYGLFVKSLIDSDTPPVKSHVIADEKLSHGSSNYLHENLARESNTNTLKESNYIHYERSLLNVSTTVEGTNLQMNSHKWLIERFKEIWPVSRWEENGLFDISYLELVNKHWLQFPPPDPSVNYALGALYLLLMVVGCSGNSLVVFMYLKCRSLRTPGNILVLNLAISDFFLLAKTPIFIFNSFYQGPALGKTGCQLYGFLGGLTGVTSIMTLSAIALDRYWAVVRPLDPLKALTQFRAKLLTMAAWTYAIAFSIVPVLDFGYGHYVPEGYLTSCSFDYLSDDPKARHFIFVFFCAGWVMPFLIISFSYLKIFKVVVSTRKIGKKSEHRLSSRHVKEQTKRKAEIKLAGLVIGIIVLFFLSWTPYAIVALIGIFGDKTIIVPILSMVPALFCKTASCINPFIYIISHPKFRKEFNKMINKKGKHTHFSSTNKSGYASETRDMTDAKGACSEDDVEVVQMKDIPYYKDNIDQIPSVAAKLEDKMRNENFQAERFEDQAVPPSSLYSKPQFTKKKSLKKRLSDSLKSKDSIQSQ